MKQGSKDAYGAEQERCLLGQDCKGPFKPGGKVPMEQEWGGAYRDGVIAFVTATVLSGRREPQLENNFYHV